jgi:hypothetical protein
MDGLYIEPEAVRFKSLANEVLHPTYQSPVIFVSHWLIVGNKLRQWLLWQS